MATTALLPVLLASQMATASHTLSADPLAPIFHISPAQCHGGWINDPNGPFTFKNVSHMFYQYHPLPCKPGPGPGHCIISWGHVAGNLSHWYCLPLAILPGQDYDGSNTSYDESGIFTGSVTIVGDKGPVATYPGMPGSKMCQAMPVDLNDPFLITWKKYKGNPIKPPGPHPSGPLGCTSAWQEESGNWTTTIQAIMNELPLPGEALRPDHQRTDVGVAGGKLRTTFWTSSNFADWSYVGVLSCPVCDLCVQSCSDFYEAPGRSANRWAFGINTGGCGLQSGGMITGTFDRTTLSFTPDRSDWAAAVLAGDHSAAQHWAYDYGPFSFPKLSGQNGRRIVYAWLNFNPGPQSNWIGMQSLPREITAAKEDDPTTAMLSNPVAEIDALRAKKLASEQGVKLGGGGGKRSGVQHLVTTARGTHLDILVTWKGLRALSAADRTAFRPAVTVFAGAGNRGHTISWQAIGTVEKKDGWVNGIAGGGPLALRASQDELSVRVLVDASVVETFWDGGRARYTAQVSSQGSRDGVIVSAGAVKPGIVVADIEVYEMSSMWLSLPALMESTPTFMI
jgi:beta-fructofuranosidase